MRVYTTYSNGVIWLSDQPVSNTYTDVSWGAYQLYKLWQAISHHVNQWAVHVDNRAFQAAHDRRSI